jgi:hypothetical protein
VICDVHAGERRRSGRPLIASASVEYLRERLCACFKPLREGFGAGGPHTRTGVAPSGAPSRTMIAERSGPTET